MAEDVVEDLVAHILEYVDSGAMVTKFIVLIEGIDSEGTRSVYMSTNEEAKIWDNLGLLNYGIAQEQEGIRRGESR